jgi:hypothetical protein
VNIGDLGVSIKGNSCISVHIGGPAYLYKRLNLEGNTTISR